MMQKVIAFIELWIGLGFFIILLGHIPVVGNTIAGVLSSIMGIVAQIPFYGIILALLGTVLICRLRRHHTCFPYASPMLCQTY